MDVSRPIIYRGFSFNDPLVGSGPTAVAGCVVNTSTMGNVEITGYTEKRALDDGRDASDVFKGRYAFSLLGTIYGSSRGDLWDRLHSMEVACDPRMAKEEFPDVQGFAPMTFYEPSEHPDWPDGTIPLFIGARATSGVLRDHKRDGSGVSDEAEIALPYRVNFEAKDPRKYVQYRQDYNFGGWGGGALVLSSRGALAVPLNILFVCDPQPATDRVFTFVGAGADFEIDVPAGSDTVVIRIDGEKKFVTLQAGDREVKAMHLRTPNAEWPKVPHGDTPVAWTFKRTNGDDANVRNDSLIMFREAFP